MPRLLALSCALIVAVATPGSANADEKNPAVEACKGKSEGEACTAILTVKSNEGQPQNKETPGQCRADECCELDYSKGSPPDTKCGPCLACKAGAPRPTPDAPEVTAGGEDGKAADGGEAPRTSSDPPTTSPNEKRGCTVGGSSAPGSVVWLMVLLAMRRRFGTRQRPKTTKRLRAS